MIDRNHPAVEAAARAALDAGWTCDTHEPRPWGDCDDCTASHLSTAPKVLAAALPHLTADDLRHTEAGRALMAEAWEEGVMAHAEATGHLTPGARHIINETMRAANPYKEAQ